MALWRLGKVILDWKQPGPLKGLKVTMRRKPLEEVLDGWVADADDIADDRPTSELNAEEKVARAKQNAAQLVKLIVDWNIADADDKPAPVTVESLLAYCDNTTINGIWDKYTEETTRVAPPLPSSSDGGQPSAEQALQLPMEPLPSSPS